MNKSESIDITNVDSIVTSVLKKFVERSILGKKKYGTDLDRTDLDRWTFQTGTFLKN
jgi:hypothetical protein